MKPPELEIITPETKLEIGTKVWFMCDGFGLPSWNFDRPERNFYDWNCGTIHSICPNNDFLIRYKQFDGIGHMWQWPDVQRNALLYHQEGYLRIEARTSQQGPTAKSNDGQEFCLWCGTKTKQVQGFMYNTLYNVCPKCGK